MESRVKKWGNSLGIRIPQSVASGVGLSENSVVDLQVQQGQIIIRPRHKRYDLDELLAQVRPDNIHCETEWGSPVGKEVW